MGSFFEIEKEKEFKCLRLIFSNDDSINNQDVLAAVISLMLNVFWIAPSAILYNGFHLASKLFLSFSLNPFGLVLCFSAFKSFFNTQSPFVPFVLACTVQVNHIYLRIGNKLKLNSFHLMR